MFYYGACDSLSISITYGSEMSKLRILCLAAASAISASAASPMKKNHGGVSGWGVGFVGGLIGIRDGASLVVEHKSADAEYGFSFGARMFHFETDNDQNQYAFGMHYGKRKMVKPQFAISAGFDGTVGAVDRWTKGPGFESIPYVVGAYTGFSYEPTKYLSQYFRILPVSYKEDGETASSAVGILSDCKFGMTYHYQ